VTKENRDLDTKKSIDEIKTKLRSNIPSTINEAINNLHSLLQNHSISPDVLADIAQLYAEAQISAEKIIVREELKTRNNAEDNINVMDPKNQTV